MNRTTLTSILIAILLLGACKADTREDTTPAIANTATASGTTTAEPATAAQPEDPSVPEANEKKSFGELIEGRTSVVVTQNDKFPGPVKLPSNAVTLDADAVAKLVAAVGADAEATDGVPRCPSSYEFTFKSDGAEDLVLSGVCGGSEDVVLVWDKLSYHAADSKGVLDVLRAAK